jgi:hypothetical protein
MKQVTGVGNERSLWRLVTTTLCLKSAMLTADLISLETAFPNYTSFKTNVTASRCARSGFSHRSIFDRCKSARRKLHDLVKNRDFIKRTLIRRATAPSSGIFVGDFPENSITCTRRFTPSQAVKRGFHSQKKKKIAYSGANLTACVTIWSSRVFSGCRNWNVEVVRFFVSIILCGTYGQYSLNFLDRCHLILKYSAAE